VVKRIKIAQVEGHDLIRKRLVARGSCRLSNELWLAEFTTALDSLRVARNICYGVTFVALDLSPSARSRLTCSLGGVDLLCQHERVAGAILRTIA
jgi:hypothetical protein